MCGLTKQRLHCREIRQPCVHGLGTKCVPPGKVSLPYMLPADFDVQVPEQGASCNDQDASCPQMLCAAATVSGICVSGSVTAGTCTQAPSQAKVPTPAGIYIGDTAHVPSVVMQEAASAATGSCYNTSE